MHNKKTALVRQHQSGNIEHHQHITIGAVYPFILSRLPRKGKENMKTPKAKKLPSGSWYVRVRIDGQDVSITRPTEKEALAEAMAVKAGLSQHKKDLQNNDLTVLQAMNDYIESRRSVLSPATIRGYCIIRDNRFQSVSKMKIRSISKERWQQLVNIEARQVSAKTLKNAWGFVSSVIRAATGESMTVRLPQVVPQNRPFLEPEEIPTFLEAIIGDPAEIIALLALSSLRRSEIMALNWEDVDLKKRLLKVNGASVPDENNHYVHKPETKNQASRRTVPIIQPLYEAMLKVPNRKGQLATMHLTTAYNRINQACKKAGLPEVGLHGLRHSFASLAYHLQMPEKVAMEIGGWANDATMKKIYTHVARNDVNHYKSAFTEFFENGDKNDDKNGKQTAVQ